MSKLIYNYFLNTLLKKRSAIFIVYACLFFCVDPALGQFEEYNLIYDESKVPEYALPSLFETKRGITVNSVNEWKFLRRPEIIHKYEHWVYGQIPRHFNMIRFEIVKEDHRAISNSATLKEVDITVMRNGNSVTIRMNLFIPRNIATPVPAFLLINHRSPNNIDPTRQIKREFWPVEHVISKGYAMASFHVGDVADDDKNTWQNDILKKLYPEQLNEGDGMKALGAWGWGAMRLMDYFERDPDINHNQVVLVGHSRGGKSALWTGAVDQRFAIVVSNESGCGGAALYKRQYGESIKLLNDVRPHWFCDNLVKYNNREESLPVDQHMLIASIAPRPVYIASAKEDEPADPKGEFLALKHASEVYPKIYHLPVNIPENSPPVNQPIIKSYAGYHIREGEHDLKIYDWTQFIKFANYHFKK